MALNIKNPDVEQLAHALAEATGESITAAVGDALRVRLKEIKRRKLTPPNLLREIRQIQETVAALPILDAREPDQFLYDDLGLPK
ncbi:MAG: type II toxin-antitoxin system VapB family antitoxin [Gemmatimonadaceae bacterium]